MVGRRDEGERGLLLEALLEAVDAELCNGGKPPHECFLSIRSDQKGMVPEIRTTPYRSLLSEQQQPAADGGGVERRLGEGLARPPASMAASHALFPEPLRADERSRPGLVRCIQRDETGKLFLREPAIDAECGAQVSLPSIWNEAKGSLALCEPGCLL